MEEQPTGIDYSENVGVAPDKIDKQSIKVVDSKGRPVKLSEQQKSTLYGRAKELKEEIKSGLCTKDECFNPTENNVKKMLNSEFKLRPKVEVYNKIMRMLGADPREVNIETLRRGK